MYQTIEIRMKHTKELYHKFKLENIPFFQNIGIFNNTQ